MNKLNLLTNGAVTALIRSWPLAIALLFFPGVAPAATLSWTTAATSVCTDGTGTTWSTAGATSNHWMLVCGTGVPSAWTNGNDAIIGVGNGAAGTITLSGNPQVKNLTNFAAGSGDYTLTASKLRITGTAASPSIFYIDTGRNFNIGTSGTIAVQDATTLNTLQKEGAGVLHLRQTTGATNTYTGGTILNAGGLTIALSDNLGSGKFTINSGRFSSFNTTTVSITNSVDLGGNATIGHVSASGAVSFNAAGTWTIKAATRTLTINSGATINQVIGNDTSGAGLTKAGNSNLTLTAVSTYDGPTAISAGALTLGASAGLASGSSVNISAGATFNVSAQATWTLGSGASLIANGTGTTVGTTAADIKGGTTVDLTTRPVILTFTPTAFAGDTTHPALYLETGTLSLGGNAFTVTNAAATPLGIGTYRILQQASGSVTTAGAHTVTVAGTGLAPSTTASIVVSGGNVNLVVSSASPATQIQPETAVDGSGTLVPGQTVNSGNAITVYAIARAADNSFVGNVAATWSLQNLTGGIVNGDLVPSGDTKSAVFTGSASGTANIRTVSGILTSTDSGTITVTCGTATTTNPSDQITPTGSTATFTVSAGSSSLPTYQWQTNNGSGWANVGGATSASHTTPAATLAMNLLQYRCIVSVACDSSSATSTAATLYVADPTATSYRSAASTAWATLSTWQESSDNGAHWLAATTLPTDANNTNITIQLGHNVTSSGTVSADDLAIAGTLTISGGAFTIANGTAAIDCDVTGTIEQTGGTLTATGALKVENGGTFKWNVASAPVIPSATWADGSECLVANATASGNFQCTGISGQNFHKFTWTAANAGRAYFNISGTATRVRTNMNITLTGAGTATLALGSNGTGGPGSGTLEIDGDLNVTTGTGKLLFNDASATNILNLYGNLNIQGNVDANSSPAIATINIKGSGTRFLNMTGTQSNAGRTAIGMDTGSYLMVSNTFSATLGGQTIDGTWEQENNGGVIPTATWGPNSTAIIKGATSSAPSGLGQIFNNFTWDSAGQSANIGLSGPAFTNNGTFWLKNTAGKEVRIASTQSPAISISNLLVDASSLVLSSSTGSPIVNATNVTISSGGTLKLSTSTGAPVLNVFGTFTNAGLLGGNGSISGVVNNNGTLAPGASLGSITLSNSPALNGALVMEINRTNAPTADLLTVTAPVVYGGTLTVINISDALQAGDTFTLFPATGYSGTFSAVTLPALAGGLGWNTNNLPVNGTLTVVTLGVGPVITSLTPLDPAAQCSSSVTFTAIATGTDPLAYQWSTNGTPVGGATATNFTLSNIHFPTPITVSVTVTNGFGTVSSNSVVTVIDTLAPAITLLGANPATNQCHSGYTDAGATAFDSCAGGVSVSNSSTVNTNVPGNYTVTYTTDDGNGNTNTTTRTVVVVDNLAPVITILGNNPATNYATVPFVDPGATAGDSCAGAVAVTTNGTVDVSTPGTYTLQYVATDPSGNSATNSRTVVVVELVAPVITSEQLLGNGSFEVTFTGPEGQPYTLLSSPDLTLPQVNWTILTNGTFGPSATVYPDTTSTNDLTRFYRVRSP